MRTIDYGWIIIIILVIVGFFLYKPVVKVFQNIINPKSKQERFARAKELFYDYKAWGYENRSCAMCHAKDYTTNPQKPTIDMPDFRYVPLENIKAKYPPSLMGPNEALMRQINRCLSSPGRINGGTIYQTDERMELLMLYVYSK